MLIKRRKGWEIAESSATPEALFFNRRSLLRGAGAAILAGAAVSCGDETPPTAAAAAETPDPSAALYPATRAIAFTLDRDVTREEIATTYNNYYEFGSHKRIYRDVESLAIRPWDIAIEGMVEEPFTLGIDDLLKKVPLEERLYRHRCVEAWAMAVPWSGFPMRALVDLARPLSGASYVEMTTFLKPSQASGQRQPWYPWPYTEGLTMAEAANDLAFLATGVYGKSLPKQMGSPLRLATPWKYGFKSIKGIVRFKFTDKRPKTFWEDTGPTEYGFWANVNPEVPHPRWSQATEELIGTGSRVPTQLFNGYADHVADLYKDMPGEKLFM